MENGQAVDSEGNRFPAKTVLPVSGATEGARAEAPQVLGRAAKFKELEAFVALAKEFAKKEQTLSNFGEHLKGQAGWTAAVERLRW